MRGKSIRLRLSAKRSADGNLPRSRLELLNYFILRYNACLSYMGGLRACALTVRVGGQAQVGYLVLRHVCTFLRPFGRIRSRRRRGGRRNPLVAGWLGGRRCSPAKRTSSTDRKVGADAQGTTQRERKGNGWHGPHSLTPCVVSTSICPQLSNHTGVLGSPRPWRHYQTTLSTGRSGPSRH